MSIFHLGTELEKQVKIVFAPYTIQLGEENPDECYAFMWRYCMLLLMFSEVLK
jgi:hypothetical protein